MTIKAINVRNQFKGHIKEIVLGDVLRWVCCVLSLRKSCRWI